jgi:hypothetical protein
MMTVMTPSNNLRHSFAMVFSLNSLRQWMGCREDSQRRMARGLRRYCRENLG